ncbi:MAG: uracil-DNA glycosylase [Gemmatimonadota bacterium]
MDDRARYLRQQAELGGAEVVLSAPVARKAAVAVKDESRGPSAEHRGTRDEVRETRVEAPPTKVAEPVEEPLPLPSTPKGPKPLAKPGSWLKTAPPIPGPGLSYDPPVTFSELATLEAVAAVISGCRLCALCEGRTHTVPGEGDPEARFLVVGEGPGANEDATGRPFVGRAGDLLDDILAGIGIARSSAYILNTVKCRPPSNRTPLPGELAACAPYLHRQIAILRPKVILAAGSTAIAALLQVKKSLGQLRGQVHRYAGIPVIATYHPAALLRNPNWKKPTWDDVRIARQLFDA